MIVQFHSILGLIGDEKTTVNIPSGFTNDIEMVHFEVKSWCALAAQIMTIKYQIWKLILFFLLHFLLCNVQYKMGAKETHIAVVLCITIQGREKRKSYWSKRLRPQLPRNWSWMIFCFLPTNYSCGKCIQCMPPGLPILKTWKQPWSQSPSFVFYNMAMSLLGASLGLKA